MSNHINTLGEVFAFLKELQHNNNREWFAAHKQQYDYLRDTWLNDLQSLIAQMSDYDPSLRGVQAKDCAYRIYRDIRFSADKTPYKTYYSAVIGAKGRKTSKAAYYLHLQPGKAGLYFGMWCPTPELLRSVRSLIDAEHQELSQLLNAPDFASRYQFEPFQTLKRMPAGFDVNHPMADMIKAKDFTWGYPRPDNYFTSGDWVKRVADDMRHAKPIIDFLNYVFE